MPEMPEVETVRLGLMPFMLDKKIAKVELRRENLRFPFDADLTEKLEGQTISKMVRRSKYLNFFFEEVPYSLIVHLGMSGKFELKSHNEAGMYELQKHDHVIIDMEDGGRIIYNDPRRFGFFILNHHENWQEHELLKHIGVEALSDDLTPQYLADHSIGKKSPIKNHLLNQKIIAGLGNIYVCEALYRAGIHPSRPSNILATKAGKPSAKNNALIPHIKDVLIDALASGGSSLKDYRQADGNLGYFQHKFKVYGREGEACLKESCNGTIDRIEHGGRSSFYCPKCQK